MISGLTSTSLALGSSLKVTSMTVIRLLIPICGAARPTPCAAYMDSNMSSISVLSASSNSVTVAAGVSRTGSPYRTMGYTIYSSEPLQLLLIAFKIAQRLGHGITTELIQRAARQGERDHGFRSHACRRHHTDIRALIRSLHRLTGCKIHGAKRTTQ